MTIQVPTHEDIERIVILTVDALRWDECEGYQEVFPGGVWYRGTSQATYTPASHACLFTGLNPPRTGVLDFGDPLAHENILTNVEDTISMSPMTKQEYDMSGDSGSSSGFLPMKGVETVNGGYKWFQNDDEVFKRIFNGIENNSVTFVHDWSVHAGELKVDKEWEGVMSDIASREESQFPLQYNLRSYPEAVRESVDLAHAFVDELKDRGLYENTLFIVWGDHGQGMGHPPLNATGHSQSPVESSCRVPISFTSPLFDEVCIDAETNARSVDVFPTLISIMETAGINFTPPNHEMEGVDLTEFDGALYGYSIGRLLKIRGCGDAITDNEKIFLNGEYRTLLEKTETESGHTVSVPIEDDFTESVMDEKRRNVRQNRSKLIKNRPPNEENLRAMGYI